MKAESVWVSVSEATRLTGYSVRTIKRMVDEKKLKASRSPGGHLRVLRADLDKLVRPENPAAFRMSSVLSAKRENVEALALELQAERVKRDLKKLRAEDAELERRRVVTARADELERNRVAKEEQRQAARDGEERRARARERNDAEKRRKWGEQWIARAMNSLPDDVPCEVELRVGQAIEVSIHYRLISRVCDPVR